MLLLGLLCQRIHTSSQNYSIGACHLHHYCQSKVKTVDAALILPERTLATFKATLYFCPSFSSSARTQSVIQGVHSAYRQSIIP